MSNLWEEVEIAFEKAAELGCPDFVIGGEPSYLVFFVWDDDYKDAKCPLPYQALNHRPQRTIRINRYAACVCECFWRDRKDEEQATVDGFETSGDRQTEACKTASINIDYANNMIALCRRFRQSFEEK